MPLIYAPHQEFCRPRHRGSADQFSARKIALRAVIKAVSQRHIATVCRFNYSRLVIIGGSRRVVTSGGTSIFQQMLHLDAVQILGKQRELFRKSPENIPVARKYFRMLFNFRADKTISSDLYAEHVRSIRKMALEQGRITLSCCVDDSERYQVAFPLLLSHADRVFSSHEAAVQYIEHVICLSPPPFDDQCNPPICGMGR